MATYFNQGDNFASTVLPQLAPIDSAIQNKRDLNFDPYAMFKGGASLEDTLARINGTPTYDPTKGPVINYGQGNTQLPQGSDFNYINTFVGANAPQPTPLSPYTGGSINGSNLTPATPIQYNTPKPTVTPDVSGLGTDPSLLQETPQEKNASDLSKRIQDMNNNLLGESAYRTQEENAYGLPALEQTQNDLTSQLNALKNDAAKIPLVLNRDAAGQGITATILGRQQEKLTQDNAIAALSVNSLLEASRGNLAMAQSMVDRAVAAKYDPIKEQISVAKSNLDLILNSPDYTREEKNQALTQKAAQDAKDLAVQKAADNTKEVLNIALEAAKNGADAVTLKNIQAATTPAAAIAAAGTSLATANTQVVKLSSGADVLIDSRTGKVIKTLGGGASGSGGGGGGNVVQPGANGTKINVPISVAPYYNVSNSGVGYADLSDVQGTAKEKSAIVNAAQAAGLKVILNKNTAADLVNIKDANSKLDTIAGVMSTLSQPGALVRGLYGIGLSKLAVLAETNPQKAAAGSLQAVGLDMLKALSGVQGFRGNATVVQQINNHLPTIYDTKATAQQKIDYLRQLISDREDGIVGKSTDSSKVTSGTTSSGLKYTVTP